MLELFVAAYLLFGTISDPGWIYESPRGQAVMDYGLRFDLPVESGLKPRIHGSSFAGSLGIELDLTNVSGGALALSGPRDDPRTWKLAIHDGEGRALPRRAERVICDGKHEGSESSIGPGETCRLSSTLSVAPIDPGIGLLWMHRNPALERISVSIAPYGFSTPLVWRD